MRKRKEHVLEEAPINLTPLIDVVFVILIMFIVVAPLLEIDRVNLAEGNSLKKPPAQEQNVVIHVFADDQISFNKQLVSLEQLEKLLINARAKYPTSYPQLFHDKKGSFGSYQSVKNAVEAAGFSQLDVLLKPH